MTKKTTKIKILSLMVFLLSLLTPASVSAYLTYRLPDASFSLTYEINAGSGIKDKVILVNNSDEEVIAEIYGADGARTNIGSFAIKSRISNPKNLGAWIKFDSNFIDLEPNSEKEVEFELSIPSNITPGGYGGGIAISQVSDNSITSGAGAKISTRIGLPVYVSVPGEKITDFEWESYNYKFDNDNIFEIKLVNHGNTIIKASGAIEILDKNNQVLEELPLNVLLFKDDEANISKSFKNAPYFGYFKARTSLEFYEQDLATGDQTLIDSMTKEVSFSIIPWKHLYLIGFVILSLIIVLVTRKFTHDKFIASCSEHLVQEGETLNGIAKMNNIKWEKLAEINHIEPPYELTPGTKILVPPKHEK